MNLTGRKIGKVLDTQALVKDKAKQVKDQVRNTPTNLKYILHKGLEKTKKHRKNLSEGLFKKSRSREVNDNAEMRKWMKSEKLGRSNRPSWKRRSNVSIKEDPKPQKDRILKNELPKRIVMVKPNSEVRRLVKQNLVARENNQLLSKKNSFQQVKQRSTLPKRANQKYKE